MVTPLVGIAFSSAGFVLGSISPGLRTLGPHWTDTFGATGDERDRVMRRYVLLPAILVFPLAGLVCDSFGAKSATLFGLLAVGVALGMLAVTPKSVVNLFGLAAGAAFLAVGSIGWMPSLLGSPGRTVEAMNLGFFGIGLGSLAGPMLTRQSLRWLGARGTLFSAAALSLVSFGLLSRAEGEPIVATTLAHPDLRFWLMAAALAIFIPVECGLRSWIEPFAGDLRDRRPAVVRTRLIGFWAAYLAARLVTYWFVRTDFESWFLMGCALVAAMTLGNLVGTYASSSGSLGYWLVGFCLGPVLPGLLGMLENAAPGRFGLVVGVLLSLAAVYQTLVGPVLAKSTRSPREAMRLPILVTLALTAPLLLATLLK